MVLEATVKVTGAKQGPGQRDGALCVPSSLGTWYLEHAGAMLSLGEGQPLTQ